MSERADITAPVAEICAVLGLDESYVARLDFSPGRVNVELFCGKEGRCQGAKYIDLSTGEPVMEELTFEVWA